MRAILGWGIALGLTSVQVMAQEGYSTAYTQCINHAYGQTARLQKCVDAELKHHNKRLKKSYRNYYKVSGIHRQNIAQQHQLWKRQLKQQCYSSMNNEFSRLQQSRCLLTRVIDQANAYQTKLVVYQ